MMFSASSTPQGGSPASNVASRSRATFAVSTNSMIKKFVFASEWFFKPEGVKSVQQRLDAELDRRELGKNVARIEWKTEDQAFSLACPHSTSEQVWEIFFKVVQEIITQESGGRWDGSDDESDWEVGLDDSDDEVRPSKSRKIQHVSTWKKEHGITEVMENDEEVAGGSFKPMLGIDFPEQVKYYKAKTAWKYEATTPSLDELLPDDVLHKLARLITSCEFAKDLNQGKIFIGASSEEACRRAICKFDNIRKNFGLRYIYLKHLFYAEDVENHQVSFRHIFEVKKKFLETTLLDNLQVSPGRFDYHNLPMAVTVRCAVFNEVKSRFVPFKAGKYVAAVGPDDKYSGPREWKDFRYSSHIPDGRETDNAMTRFEYYTQKCSKLLEPEQTVQAEPESTEAQNLETTELPLGNSHEDMKAGSIQRWKAGVVNQDVQAATGNFQNEQSESAPSSEQQMRPDWDTYIPFTEECVRTRKKHHRLATQFHTTIAPLSNRVPQPTAEQTITQDAIQELLVSTSQQDPQVNVVQSSSQTTDVSSAQSSMRDIFQDSPGETTKSEFNCLDEENSILDVPVLQPSRKMSALPTSPSPSTATFIKPNDLFGSPPRVLTNYPVLQREYQQRVNEVATRTFYSTMNQKAQKPGQKPPYHGSKSVSIAERLGLPNSPTPRRPSQGVLVPVNDPTLNFIRDINKSFYELLEGLRGFRGEVNVQADFGRILLKGIPRKAITRDNLEASLDTEYAMDVLGNTNGSLPMTVFTKVLTLLPADISYLIERKDRQGHTIWEQSQSSWEVTYEILCVDHRPGRSRPFTIEINGEKLDTAVVKTRREFGAINVHGVKRHWDFRIVATGNQPSEDIDPFYREFAEAVKSSLHIPEGLRNPILFFEIPDHLSSLVLYSVRVRRTSCYRSVDSRSILKVCEVKDLQLFDVRGDEKLCTIWKAVGSLVPQQSGGTLGHIWLYNWHEASITCPKADEMFEQNKSIELGDEASWTPEKLSNVDAAQSLYLPACEMLKQMDGVGFYNENDIDSQAVQGSVASTVPGIVEQPWYFW